MNCGLLSGSSKHCGMLVYYAIANIASWVWQRRMLFSSLQTPVVVVMLRRWFAHIWPYFVWPRWHCQIFGDLAEGDEATEPSGSRVCYSFNLPEEGNYPVFPYREVTSVLVPS